STPCGCPGSQVKTVKPLEQFVQPMHTSVPSQLQQWPVQIKLVPVNAPYFHQAHLLIAADCTAFAYGNFHADFMKKKICLIGCPKLDEGDYTDKLTAIIQQHQIQSITVVRMEVPCCGGIVNAVKTALLKSGKMIPWQVAVVSTDGQLIA
ncbi:MAG: 4Fe-4S ferredoxin, partial [Acutalibacteraceae bacterium]